MRWLTLQLRMTLSTLGAHASVPWMPRKLTAVCRASCRRCAETWPQSFNFVKLHKYQEARLIAMWVFAFIAGWGDGCVFWDCCSVLSDLFYKLALKCDLNCFSTIARLSKGPCSAGALFSSPDCAGGRLSRRAPCSPSVSCISRGGPPQKQLELSLAFCQTVKTRLDTKARAFRYWQEDSSVSKSHVVGFRACIGLNPPTTTQFSLRQNLTELTLQAASLSAVVQLPGSM